MINNPNMYVYCLMFTILHLFGTRHVMIRLFEATTTTKQASAWSLTYLLDEYGLKGKYYYLC
jgi:hypothetical protein